MRLFLMDFGHGELLRHALRASRDHPPLRPLPVPQRRAGRESTPEEVAFLGEGGYRELFQRAPPDGRGLAAPAVLR